MESCRHVHDNQKFSCGHFLKHENIKFCNKFQALTRKHCVVQIPSDKHVSGVK